jgi:hypothetical protein
MSGTFIPMENKLAKNRMTLFVQVVCLMQLMVGLAGNVLKSMTIPFDRFSWSSLSPLIPFIKLIFWS